MRKALMRLARRIVETVMRQVANLIQRVIMETLNPVNAILSEIQDGTWEGDGANRFVEEVNSRLITDIKQSVDSGNLFDSSITRAMDIITQADEDAAKLMNNWADDVAGICKF